jgi:hypothetical protein
MRLSLYKEEKGLDYQFIDRQISEMFTIGGTGVYLHKYIGPKNPAVGTADQPIYDSLSVTNIQDLLFLENRDRRYDSEIYRIRGIYNVQNIDFNLSQFGIFIDNDTIFMTIHINDFIKYVGRKQLNGDVMELPHLTDEFALNNYDISLPRYYVIEDVGRASEGFSATWYPHLYRIKLKKVSGTQQFADIFNKPVGEDADKFVGDYVPGTVYYPGQIVRVDGIMYQVKTDGSVPESGTTLAPPNPLAWIVYSGSTLESLLSTRDKSLEINDAMISQAEADSPLSGYETRHYWTLSVDPATGDPIISTSEVGQLVNGNPPKSGYFGYLLGDGIPPNGYPFGYGIQFPPSPTKEDYYLRTDFLPNRLFRFDGVRWVKIEDKLRMTMTQTNTRHTQKTGFINNTKYTYVEELGSDMVPLVKGAIIINTDINYITGPYITLKFNGETIDYAVADYPTLITSYLKNNIPKIRVTLPVIKGVQETIPATGTWGVFLYNHREEQRQSLSKVLKPRADV